MIKLELHNPSWIGGVKDDPNDKCAHSCVHFSIGDTVFVSPEDGDWTVSASALYLLRTLSLDHKDEENGVTNGDFIFPCCAFTGFILDETNLFPIAFSGCDNGIDIWITHQSDLVLIENEKGSATISRDEWTEEVLRFVDEVIDFYKSCSAKIYTDEENKKVWNVFWDELYQRRKNFPN